MQGAGGQSVWIDKAHDLVIVRLGNFKGAPHAGATLSKAMEILPTESYRELRRLDSLNQATAACS